MDMMSLRRGLMGQQQNLFPAIYRKVNYLQSTGTQYFWTDIYIQDGLTVDCVQESSGAQDSYLFGGITTSVSQSARSCFNGAYNTSLQGSYPGAYYLINNILQYNIVYHIVTTHKEGTCIVYIDGTKVKETNSGGAISDSQVKCACFAGRKGDGTTFEFYKGKVYSLKVSKNGILYADYIPCVRKSDGKPGMYDTVTKTFYTNAGTGEFIVPA